MAAFKDYYQTLGVDKSSTKEDIRRAFRKLAAKHHPDRNPGDASAEERFKEINEAYTVLSDDEKRKLYDQYGSTGAVPPFAQGGGGTRVYSNVSPEEFAGFSDFFQSLFGGFQTRGGYGSTFGDEVDRGTTDPFVEYRSAPRPRAVEARLDVGLLDAYRGGPTTIRVDGKGLEVTLPKGVRDGAKLRLRGQAPGGGDLILQVRHLPHPTFRLDGDRVRVSVKVPDHVAALGGQVKVPTLDGDVETTLPEGSSSGRVLRLRGKGWPTKSGGRGDELVEVRVTVPETPSEEQRKLYERLAALERGAGGAPVGGAGAARGAEAARGAGTAGDEPSRAGEGRSGGEAAAAERGSTGTARTSGTSDA
ncbi:MAG: DnaJ C-terminal domain-containing protein [Trueperaceae bacterium]